VAKDIQRVLIVGQEDPTNLESSYQRAFECLGCEVATFDITKAVDRRCRLGRFGRLLNTYLPVTAWVRKANRDLILEAVRLRPDLILVFGFYPVRAGALAQIKALLDVTLVHIWPDPLVNLDEAMVCCLPLFDFEASYSQSALGVFEKLGARKPVWIPLAADLSLHAVSECTEEEHNILGAEVAFIGGWRPEREQILSQLGSFDLKIWGPDWGRRCRGNQVIMRAWQRRPLHGAAFAKAVACSKINLNIIDFSNQYAANMRFFEILAAGGLQASSNCPEMESEFRHGEHIFYFKSPEQLIGLIATLKNNDELRTRVAAAGNALVQGKHTYQHRAQKILEYCRSPVVRSPLPFAKGDEPLTTEQRTLTAGDASLIKP